MYAIVDIAGQQFKVEKEQKLFVHRLPGDAESKVNFETVLLIDNDGKVTLGKPVIDGASVSAKILSHVKGDKVIVFKKKRRKGYKTLNGHRQLFTEIQIVKIDEKGGKKASSKAADKSEKEVKANAPAETKAKVETSAPTEKKTAKPKAEAKTEKKKPAAKKPAAKKTTKEDPKK